MTRTHEIKVPVAVLKALYAILKNECRGKDNARPKRVLMANLASRGLAVNRRTYDEAIRRLRNDTRFYVVTCGAGVFWAETLEELIDGQKIIVRLYDDLREAMTASEIKVRNWKARRNRVTNLAPKIRQPNLLEV